MYALILAKEPLSLYKNEFESWAKKQIDFILGDNINNFSYMIGYTNNYPRRVRHKGSSCPSPPKVCLPSAEKDPRPNPSPLIGAIVKGTNSDESVNDSRQNLDNMVRIIDNAPVVFILLRIQILFGKPEHIDPGLYPQPGTCLLGPEEYINKFSYNYAIYELFLNQNLDSPFPLKNGKHFFTLIMKTQRK
jgi:hypothetical protein